MGHSASGHSLLHGKIRQRTPGKMTPGKMTSGKMTPGCDTRNAYWHDKCAQSVVCLQGKSLKAHTTKREPGQQHHHLERSTMTLIFAAASSMFRQVVLRLRSLTGWRQAFLNSWPGNCRWTMLSSTVYGSRAVGVHNAPWQLLCPSHVSASLGALQLGIPWRWGVDTARATCCIPHTSPPPSGACVNAPFASRCRRYGGVRPPPQI